MLGARLSAQLDCRNIRSSSVSLNLPKLLTFFDHWRRLGNGHQLPTLRSYLDDPPFDFQPFVTITDMYSADSIRIRLMGTGLVNAVGERTGGGFNDSFTERAASVAGQLSWAASQQSDRPPQSGPGGMLIQHRHFD